MRALTIKCCKGAVMTVQRNRLWTRRMVYLLLANRSFKYSSGKRSRVIYIGTTGNGANRPATSAAAKAMDAFNSMRGVSSVDVYIVTCRKRRNVRTWELLESALLATFTARYFELPRFNRKRGEFRYVDEVQHFREKRLHSLLKQFEP